MIKGNANDKTRHLIVWEVPTSGSNAFVEMYINPENLTVDDKKAQIQPSSKSKLFSLASLATYGHNLGGWESILLIEVLKVR